jgi:hypothetical protein
MRVGGALTVLEYESLHDDALNERHRLQLYERVETVLAAYKPLFEGIALFCEFDTSPGLFSGFSPVSIAMQWFYNGGIDPLLNLAPESFISTFYGEFLFKARYHPVFLTRKIELLARSYPEPDGYLAGYLAIKNNFITMRWEMPELRSAEFYSITAADYFFGDVELSHLLLRPPSIDLVPELEKHLHGRLRAFQDVAVIKKHAEAILDRDRRSEAKERQDHDTRASVRDDIGEVDDDDIMLLVYPGEEKPHGEVLKLLMEDPPTQRIRIDVDEKTVSSEDTIRSAMRMLYAGKYQRLPIQLQAAIENRCVMHIATISGNIRQAIDGSIEFLLDGEVFAKFGGTSLSFSSHVVQDGTAEIGLYFHSRLKRPGIVLFYGDAHYATDLAFESVARSATRISSDVDERLARLQRTMAGLQHAVTTLRIDVPSRANRQLYATLGLSWIAPPARPASIAWLADTGFSAVLSRSELKLLGEVSLADTTGVPLDSFLDPVANMRDLLRQLTRNLEHRFGGVPFEIIPPEPADKPDRDPHAWILSRL